MKQDTMHHPKTLDLKSRLNIPIGFACGILESMWQWASKYAPQGDIGRFPNEAFATAIEWPGDANRLFDALEQAGWIDADAKCRYVIHDWPDHCTDGVHLFLARRVLFFANGQMPKLTRLSKSERREIATRYKQAHGMRTDSASKRTTTTPTTTSTTTSTSTTTPTERGGAGGIAQNNKSQPEHIGKSVEALVGCVGSVGGLSTADPGTGTGTGKDDRAHFRALIDDVTRGTFQWRKSHTERLRRILSHDHGAARVTEICFNAQSGRDPARVINAALCEAEEELGVRV